MFITTITPSTNLYTHSLPDALPISGGQICLNRNVLALLCLPGPAGDSLLKSCHVRRWNWLGASDGLQLTRHRFPRQVLRQLNVRLIVGLNANHRSRGGHRHFPTEEFLPEVEKIGGLDADYRMSHGFQPVQACL